MSRKLVDPRCTFHQDGKWCGRLEEEETSHVWPDERMRHDAHVWRHDERDEAALVAALGRTQKRLQGLYGGPARAEFIADEIRMAEDEGAVWTDADTERLNERLDAVVREAISAATLMLRTEAIPA